MNKPLSRLIAVCIALVNFPLYGQAENYLQYSHHPAPPGYGLSNYFELSAPRIQKNDPARPITARHPDMTMDAYFIGRSAVRIRFSGSDDYGPFSISVYAISGKKVYTAKVFRSGTYRDQYSFPVPLLAEGVYVVHAQFESTSLRTAFPCVYSGNKGRQQLRLRNASGTN